MHLQTLSTACGCLLRDLPLLAERSGQRRSLSELLRDPAWEPVLAALDGQSVPAVLCRAADRLSVVADDGTAHAKDGPALCSIFTHMNGAHPGWFLRPGPQDGSLRMPVQQRQSPPASRWAEALRQLTALLNTAPPESLPLNSLLALLEQQTSDLPAATPGGTDTDVSLFDRLKIRTAIGCCISEYLLSLSETDRRACLADGEDALLDRPCFLLCSADLSGIQRFIYTVADDGALRALSSRSFFLGLVMEHYADELLTGCGLTRANLLYSGGGHCYLLLPNTAAVTTLLDRFNLRFNDFLLDHFGAGLFLAHGRTACCGNALINAPAEQMPYRQMFRQVAGAVSAHKMHRYSAGQLLRLNRRHTGGERECRNCGSTDRLDMNGLCPWCSGFAAMAAKIREKQVCVVGEEGAFHPDFSLPSLDGMAGFLFTDETRAGTLLQQQCVRRIYTKNKCRIQNGCSIGLYVGDYAADVNMDRLAEESEGIRRIGVCRMDVDNLGQAFVCGFEGPPSAAPEDRCRCVTLARTMAFSRQMCLFFQLYINAILDGSADGSRALHVRIVYSGGDDVFLAGAWTDVIAAAQRIQQAFSTFTCGALTISGGIGLFDEHFPIRISAEQTAALEDRAKQEPDKNAVSLFDPEAPHTYSWQTFKEQVVGEKYAALRSFFTVFPERGNAFLYRLLLLLRPVEGGHSINLARYAYQLARLEPKKSDARQKDYRRFADQMYRWAWNQKDREQLITAIYLYVYQHREKKEGEHNER